MSEHPFFVRDGERLVPTSASRGPWSETSLHGRVVIGLLAREIERRHGDPDFLPARLTVDMYRLADLWPATVTTRAIREGGRVKLIEAEFFSAGASRARASCQWLRRTVNPAGRVWSPPAWEVPAPADIAPPADDRGDLGGMWETRPIEGAFGALGRRRLWMREVRKLIADEPLTPFSRVALAADFASPFANAGEAGLAWINSDVTLYLHRLPAGEWIGFEVVNHQAGEGVAIAECWLYDEAGSIGAVTVAALAQKRGMGL